MVVAMESYALRDSNVVTKLRKLKIKELLHDERSAHPKKKKRKEVEFGVSVASKGYQGLPCGISNNSDLI